MSNMEFEDCVRVYGKDIFSFLCRMTGNRQEAEELYQDTFLKLLELGEAPDPGKNPKNYLLTIAVNLWKNRRRKFAWRQRITGGTVPAEELDAVLPSDGNSPEESVISMEERRAVREAVLRLPHRYRVVVVLMFMESMKISEIACLLHIPEGTVKSRIYKAKRMLERELEGLL